MSQLGTIILVPGIGGNSLFTHESFFGAGPRIHLWLNPGPLVAFGWLLMELGPDGVTPAVPLTGPLIPGAPLQAYYGDLIRQYQQLGWEVIGAEIDWRRTAASDGELLAALIRRHADRAPLHLLCHSRGGLVARYALQLLAASGELGLIGTSAGLGVPHYGSWQGAGLLAGWNPTAYNLRLLLDTTAVAIAGVAATAKFRNVIISWPSGYELLPAPFAPGLQAREIADVYNAALWELQGLPVKPAWMAAGLTRWGNLPFVPASIPWIDVAGFGFPTPQHLREPAMFGRSQGWEWDSEGDGHVPVAWAVQPNRVRILSPTSHQALAYDGRIVTAVSAALRDGLSEDVTISGPLLQ